MLTALTFHILFGFRSFPLLRTQELPRAVALQMGYLREGGWYLWSEGEVFEFCEQKTISPFRPDPHKFCPNICKVCGIE